ncbi:unnamed protein product [Prunus armeniaca]
MATVGVNLLRYVQLVPGCRNYQLPRGRRRCLFPLLTFLLPIRSLQTLGRFGSLDIMRLLLIEQLLSFVNFRRENIVMFLEFSHVLLERGDLGQKFCFSSGLDHGCITEGSTRGQHKACSPLPSER